MTATPIYILGEESSLSSAIPRGSAIAKRDLDEGAELWFYCCSNEGEPVPFPAKAAIAKAYLDGHGPEEARFFLPARGIEAAKLQLVGEVDEAGKYSGSEFQAGSFDRLCMVRAGVTSNKYAIMVHMGAGGLPNYAYTVGLEQNFSHPELCLVGFAPEAMRFLLIDSVNLVKQGETFTAGERRTDLIDQFAVAVREVNTSGYQMRCIFSGITSYYGQGNAFRMLQLLLPDAAGRFPWDEGCESPLCKVQTELFEPQAA